MGVTLHQLFAFTGVLALAFAAICVMALRKLRPAWFAWRLPKISLPQLPKRKAVEEAASDSIPSQRARTIKPASEGGGDLDAAEAVLHDTYYHHVEARLEQVFTQYERGRMTLATYREIVLGERQNAMRLIGRAEYGVDPGRLPSGRPIDIEDVRKALSAAEWCLEWADQQGLKEAADPDACPPPEMRDAA